MRVMLLLMMFISSCNPVDTTHVTRVSRTAQFQHEIDCLVIRDAENKRWARLYLHEIDQAMLNNDIPAYVFFVREFEKIPLEIVPVHLRDEPGYVPGPSDLELYFRLRWFEQAILLFIQQKQTLLP